MPLLSSIARHVSLTLLTVGLGHGQSWTPIFDGQTLRGWIGKGYEVTEGALVCTPQGSFLRTEKEYGDFLLDLEFKMKPGTNNGIGLRYPGTGDPAYTGMEIQVLDDRHAKFHEKSDEIKPWQYHGSVYGVEASTQCQQSHLKPLGEWNHQQILCIGDHVKVTLNGEVITDVFLTGKKPLHDAAHPGLERTTGHICFCGHADYIAYRHIRVREFPHAPPLLTGQPENTAPPGFTALFNGRDLTGWQGLLAEPHDKPGPRAKLSAPALTTAQSEADALMRAHWSIQDGALTFSGAGRSLCTAQKYADYDLYLDWKIPAKADSGIYLRGLPQVQIWDPANPDQNKYGNQKGSGGLWNNSGRGKSGKDPLILADRPIGAWNTFFIRMQGERATIYLNGQKVVDRAILENLWEPTHPIPRTEQIELQNHGNTLSFKNVYLRELPY